MQGLRDDLLLTQQAVFRNDRARWRRGGTPAKLGVPRFAYAGSLQRRPRCPSPVMSQRYVRGDWDICDVCVTCDIWDTGNAFS